MNTRTNTQDVVISINDEAVNETTALLSNDNAEQKFSSLRSTFIAFSNELREAIYTVESLESELENNTIAFNQDNAMITFKFFNPEELYKTELLISKHAKYSERLSQLQIQKDNLNKSYEEFLNLLNYFKIPAAISSVGGFFSVLFCCSSMASHYPSAVARREHEFVLNDLATPKELIGTILGLLGMGVGYAGFEVLKRRSERHENQIKELDKKIFATHVKLHRINHNLETSTKAHVTSIPIL